MPTIQEYNSKIKELENKIAYLNAQIKEQRYGLNWIDVPEAFDKDSENQIPVLEEVPELAIKNNDGKPTHILIEGDNYHALTCLSYTHRGKVDVIYIDPPYNTGSDGFTYKDKRILNQYPDGTLVPKDHPLRHSYWISFMNKRLRLAYNLLKKDGVILISINENELATLKLLCDEIFKEVNYISTFTIKVRHEDRILKGDKPIHETTEFLLMYQKSNDFKIQKRKVDNSDPSDYKYQIKELITNPKTIHFGKKEVQIFNPSEYEIIELEPDFKNLKKINIRGSIKAGNSSGRFHMSYLEERNNDFKVLYKVPDMGEDGLGYRYFITRDNARKANGSYFQGSPLGRKDVKDIPYPNFFDFEYAFNNVGTEGGVPFDGGKKPISYIEKIIKIAKGDKDITILDFFAGSGSTGHAIVDMNNAGSNSKFILVQMPELTYEIKNGQKVANKYCKNVFNAGYNTITEITYKRCLNAMNGYEDNANGKVSGLGNSLKYYRTAFVGRNDAKGASDGDYVALSQKAGCLLGLAEDTLDEIDKTDKYQFFINGKKLTAIYFSENTILFDEFVEKIRNNSSVTKIVYVYSWGSGEEFSTNFDVIKNVTIKPIPRPILDIYKTLNS
ncbi:MAG: site-specific DNA-methyltransferase [Bacteroidaceae bacterium]|nr:site-specific DNA-methyltransferase [Bacteroidaceae bacterium]